VKSAAGFVTEAQMRGVCDDLQDEAVDFASFSGFFAVPLQIFESITARRTSRARKI